MRRRTSSPAHNVHARSDIVLIHGNITVARTVDFSVLRHREVRKVEGEAIKASSMVAFSGARQRDALLLLIKRVGAGKSRVKPALVPG
jgi:hypothetical protein